MDQHQKKEEESKPKNVYKMGVVCSYAYYLNHNTSGQCAYIGSNVFSKVLAWMYTVNAYLNLSNFYFQENIYSFLKGCEMLYDYISEYRKGLQHFTNTLSCILGSKNSADWEPPSRKVMIMTENTNYYRRKLLTWNWMQMCMHCKQYTIQSTGTNLLFKKKKIWRHRNILPFFFQTGIKMKVSCHFSSSQNTAGNEVALIWKWHELSAHVLADNSENVCACVQLLRTWKMFHSQIWLEK